MRSGSFRAAGRRPLVPALVGAILVLALVPPTHGATTWTKLGSGSTKGISGLAASSSGWVIARDNKTAGQSRIALLSPSLTVAELAWPGTAPQDLESIAAVPGTANRYVACTSARACSVIDIAGTSLTVRRTFTLPGSGSNYEALAFTTVSGKSVALWAQRGSPTAAGKLRAAFVNLSTWTFGPVASASVRVPWPTGAIRHVSDAAVVNGRIIVSSATDPGDNGPFDSAVYDVGALGRNSTRPTLTVQTPKELGRFPGHKIEGISCATGAYLLGTDDEKAGGSVASVDVC
jgi:hypothetical protein